MKHIKNSQGFAHFVLVMAVVVVLVVGAVGYRILNTKNNETNTEASNSSPDKAVVGQSQAKIKSLGINLAEYDPETNMAGDIKFTKAIFSGGMQMLFYEYGYEIEANSAGPAKKNPQPTFIVPLGTKVMSLVDGEVFDVPQLYSSDYSVQVQAPGSDLIFETEHVINVQVKKGDKVKAGQVIAEVSDYDARNYDGLGLYEIGILKGGNPPYHLCPFDYLDDSIKDETLKKITALQKSWEEYRGDTTIYDESKVVTPGCLTHDPVEG